MLSSQRAEEIVVLASLQAQSTVIWSFSKKNEHLFFPETQDFLKILSIEPAPSASLSEVRVICGIEENTMLAT